MTDASSPGKVLAVIVNYNGGTCVLDCLRSLLDQTYKPLEIVVVDNASQDGSLERIQQEFPDIQVIQTGYNAGWGIACNVGMRAGESRYIALLNNDATLERNCIAELVKAIELDPKYGSAASRILLADEPGKAEVCGLVIYRDGSSCGRGRLGPADRYMKTEEVFCANDCCCLYKREMIDEIGEYDPDFFIYCDETDMGWRHQLAGWKCVYTPHAVAYHAHSRSAGTYSTFKAFYVERNRIFITFKYFPLIDLALTPFYSFYRFFLQWYFAAFKKKGALAQYRKHHSLAEGLFILIKAHGTAFLKWPAMWKKRREIRKITRLGPGGISGLFKLFGIPARQTAVYE